MWQFQQAFVVLSHLAVLMSAAIINVSFLTHMSPVEISAEVPCSYSLVLQQLGHENRLKMAIL